MQTHERIIVALDVDRAERALTLVEQLYGRVGVFKVGLELLMSEGIGVMARLRDAGAERIFCDAKLHDIPNTVAGAMRGIVQHGAWCVTVHASGGSTMLRAACETAQEEARRLGVVPPHVLAVTVLTSLSDDVLWRELGVGSTAGEQAARLATLAHEAGCDGVIASPLEIETVRRAVSDPEFLVVTPGVRSAGSDRGDQARVLTPGEAVQRGADYLVIGRPIVQASDPVAAAQAIANEIAGAMTPA